MAKTKVIQKNAYIYGIQGLRVQPYLNDYFIMM